MNKVQKIREEVVRMQKRAEHNFDTSLTGNERQFWLGESNVLTLIGKYIDSLQEEPKFKTGDRIKPIDKCLGSPRIIEEVCDGWYVTNQGTLDFEFEDNWELVREPSIPDIVDEHFMEMLDKEPVSKEIGDYDHKAVDEALHPELKKEPVSDIDFEQELYKAFGQVKDFTLGLRIAKRFYDMGKNHQEPVSEDFKIALNKKLREAQDWTYIEEEGGECPLNEEFGAFELKEFAEWGAKWQREQFEKNRLKHCNSITNEQAELEQGFIDQHLDKHQRMPTFLDAIEYGMKLMKKQMMKGAFDVKINRDTLYDLKPFIHEKYLDYKIGDKCKMILIKED